MEHPTVVQVTPTKAALHISNQPTPIFTRQGITHSSGDIFHAQGTVPYHSVHHVHQKQGT